MGLIRDEECLLRCGWCCGDCFDKGESGCLLPRNERPDYCNSFLCDIAEKVRDGKMSKEEGLRELPLAWKE
jgi:hypothetical protein